MRAYQHAGPFGDILHTLHGGNALFPQIIHKPLVVNQISQAYELFSFPGKLQRLFHSALYAKTKARMFCQKNAHYCFTCSFSSNTLSRKYSETSLTVSEL